MAYLAAEITFGQASAHRAVRRRREENSVAAVMDVLKSQ